MKQIVLDTETTGLDPAQGHRIIEIGCVELLNRRLSGKRLQLYIDPERDIDEAAIEVHGITNEFLQGKPRFEQIEEVFIEFVHGAELVIHNAPFDIGFLDHELSQTGSGVNAMSEICSVVDSLVLARSKHPGQRNNLDALCKRYGVDNTQRDLHGALLDAEILADVYLAMTSGQSSLSLKEEAQEHRGGSQGIKRFDSPRPELKIVRATTSEIEAHEACLAELDKQSAEGAIWLRESAPATPE